MTCLEDKKIGNLYIFINLTPLEATVVVVIVVFVVVVIVFNVVVMAPHIIAYPIIFNCGQ